MASLPDGDRSEILVPEAGRLGWGRLLVWVVCCGLLGTLIAWAAVVAQRYFAPLVLFPLIVGALLGGAMVLAMRVAQVGHRPTIWLGALLAVAIHVVGQHYFAYLTARQRAIQDPDRLVKLQLVAPERVPPEGFGRFMSWSASRGVALNGWTAREGLAWLIWAINGVLVALPALALVGATARLPFCNRCGRWYQTIRSGRLDRATASRVAALIGEGLEEGRDPGVAKARYRLLACRGGCGPAGLVLSWMAASGVVSSGVVWLDAARRRQVEELLDRSREQGP